MTLPNGTTELYVVLYGTGIRNARGITASIGPAAAEIPYFGAQPQYPGLDQVNLLVRNPAGFVGRQPLTLSVDGVLANSVDLFFQ